MTDLIRCRYNTTAAESPSGEWTWRVILEESEGFKEVPAKRPLVNVPSLDISGPDNVTILTTINAGINVSGSGNVVQEGAFHGQEVITAPVV
jgi:hypothetical protein